MIHGLGDNFVELSADNFLLQVASGELEAVAEELEVFAVFLQSVGELAGFLAEALEHDAGVVAR